MTLFLLLLMGFTFEAPRDADCLGTLHALRAEQAMQIISTNELEGKLVYVLGERQDRKRHDKENMKPDYKQHMQLYDEQRTKTAMVICELER